jgi:hypothetical protein
VCKFDTLRLQHLYGVICNKYLDKDNILWYNNKHELEDLSEVHRTPDGLVHLNRWLGRKDRDYRDP